MCVYVCRGGRERERERVRERVDGRKGREREREKQRERGHKLKLLIILPTDHSGLSCVGLLAPASSCSRPSQNLCACAHCCVSYELMAARR